MGRGYCSQEFDMPWRGEGKISKSDRLLAVFGRHPGDDEDAFAAIKNHFEIAP